MSLSYLHDRKDFPELLRILEDELGMADACFVRPKSAGI